jgi:hypothetical protein
MFNEAPAVKLVTEMLVEGVCVWSMITAGNLDADTPVLPSKVLDGGNEQPTDALLAKFGSNDEARDATKKAICVKQRDAMEGDKADNALN